MTAENIRLIPLGGLGEVGKNMMVVEYGDDIIIIDCGLMFPDDEMFGVDLVIPDTSYLTDKKQAAVPVLLMTGETDAATHAETLRAVGIIKKPFDPDDVSVAVEEVLSGPT